MAQEESWECPVTTNGKYVNALLKDIDYWKSLEDLKLKIMLINEALDIPYEKNEELEKLKIKKLQELYEDIDYELLPDYYKRNKDIIMTWAKGPNLCIEQLDCNLIDKDVVLRLIEHGIIYYTNDIPNKFKTDKDVIKAIINKNQFCINRVKWMDEELKKNKEFIMELIKEGLINTKNFIKEISSHFKSDKDIILAFLQNVDTWNFKRAYKSLFDWMDDTIKDDEEFMKKLIDCEKKLRDKYPYVFKSNKIYLKL